MKTEIDNRLEQFSSFLPYVWRHQHCFNPLHVLYIQRLMRLEQLFQVGSHHYGAIDPGPFHQISNGPTNQHSRM